MGKFNKKTVGKETINLADGIAYKESPELELVSLLLTSFVKDKFYENSNDQLKRLENLVLSIKDKKFIGQSAVYARTKFGMRSITHALLSELVNKVKGQSWVKNAIAKAVYRVDDLLETLAFYGNKYGKPIPNSLKKGIKLGLQKFDTYQLSKYRGANKDVKLVDLLNLVHPKPNAKQKEAFKKLIEGNLKSTETWETKLTEAGKVNVEDELERKVIVDKNKKEAWESLLKSNKLGYFALLRNIRNILEQAPESVDLALQKLVDKESIKKSLILPFQFKKAYDAVKNTSFGRKALGSLDKAVDLSVSNCPSFEGKTLIALDTSGSMSGQPLEIGKLFAAVLYKNNDADLMTFDSDGRYETLNPNSLVTDLINQISFNGGGTNFNEIFRNADKAYDRIIILSDMQGWMADKNSFSLQGGSPKKSFFEYKKEYNCNPKIYSFDLNGYGTLQFPEDNVFTIAGFSDKTLELLKLLETDRNALVNEIRKIEL